MASARSITGFVLGGVLVAIAIMAGLFWLVWSAIPEPDTRHSSVSPSGERTVYLFESCGGDACVHQAVLELPSVEGPRVQIRCGLDIEARAPQFAQIEVEWSDDENVIEIAYINTVGTAGHHRLDFEQACMGD